MRQGVDGGAVSLEAVLPRSAAGEFGRGSGRVTGLHLALCAPHPNPLRKPIAAKPFPLVRLFRDWFGEREKNRQIPQYQNLGVEHCFTGSAAERGENARRPAVIPSRTR
jgi:hypothetical protein